MVDSSQDPAGNQAGKQKPGHGGMAMPLLWVYGSGALGMAIQVGSTAILARILAPQAFGELALAAAILRVMQHVAHMGLATALTREAGRLDMAARAAILFSVCSSLLLAGLLWLCAPLLLWIQPEAQGSVAILRVLAFGPVLAAFGQAAAALLQSRLDFRKLGAAQVTAQAIGQIGVAIPLALWGFDSWSLVYGSLAQAAILSALLLFLAKPGWRGPWLLPADLLRLGFRYMLLRLLDVSGQAIPPLAVTAIAGLALAGAYDRAFVLAVVPLDWLATGLATVLFPIYVRQSSRQEAARFWTISIALGGAVLLAVAMGMLMAKEYLVVAILGQQWHDAVPLLGWLAAWGFLRGLAVLNGSMVEARSNLKFRALHQAFYVACLAGLLFLFRPTGAEHILMLLVAVEIANVAVYVWHGAAVTGMAPLPVLRSLALLLFPALGVLAVLAMLAPMLAAWPPILALALCILVATLVLAAMLYWHPAADLRALVRQILLRRDLRDAISQ